MKYTLYKELLDHSNILSHVFFTCADEFIQDIVYDNKGLSNEEIEKRKIDIELKIDGHKCDPKKFFDSLYQQYADHIDKEARKIVNEKISDKFNTISNKLQEYQEITESWANDINWNIENPLTK